MTEPNRRVRRFIHILGTQRCMYFIEPPISWIRLTVHDSTLPPHISPLTLFNRQRGVLLVCSSDPALIVGAPNPEPRTPTQQGRRRRHTRTRPHTNDARDKHARLAHVFFRASSASARRRYVRATRLDAPNDRRSMMTTTARLARRPSALDASAGARRRATRRSSETDSERGIFIHRETTRRRARRRASGVPGRRRRRRRRRRVTAVEEARKGRGAPRVGVGEGV